MYFDVLAGLRGLLALFVFIAHAWQWWGGVFFGNNKFGESLSLIAYFSVLGFFVLSGYLISVSIEKNISENPQELLLNYCVNRLTRIVPPFMLAVSFSLFVLLFIKYLDLHGAISFRINDFEVIARENVSIVNRNIFATFILSNGIMPGTGPIDSNGPLWSLSIEFWMYFIGLALYFLITKSHINYKLISLLFVLAFLVLKPIYLYFWSFYVYSIFWIIGFSLNFEITKKWLSLFSGPVSACIAILGLFLASSACGFLCWHQAIVCYGLSYQFWLYTWELFPLYIVGH
jgi:peptidoglycan/LPS O-acetylase OafA/YrhL